MKTLLMWLFIALGPCFALAQTKINKSYPVAKGQTVVLNFDYPKLVHISTWDGKTIAIVATVSINNGEADRAFTLTEKTTAGQITISNTLDMDLIPEGYYTVDQGSKIRFSSKKDLEAYISGKKGSRPVTYQQKDIDIRIDIKIPAQISTEITSTYGMVEVQGFNGPIKVDAKYGGVDASVTGNAVGKLQLTTQYGKIYTNISLQPTERVEKDFYTSITAKPGHSASYDFSSSYGNIYLRSAVN